VIIKPFIVSIGIALMMALPVHAEVYRKCVDEAGQATISNTKCPDGSKTESSFRSNNFRSPKALVTKNEVPVSIYEDQLNSVVRIKSSRGYGSGFFVTSDGLIVTNYHVVGTDRRVKIKLRTQKQIIYGRVVATDQKRDLALVSVYGQDFQWLRLGTTNDTIIGEEVIAIGAPNNLEWTVTKGVVSAIRDWNRAGKNGRRSKVRVVQTDAALNIGNSGGPLISDQDQTVVGVNTFGLNKDITEGLAFAVSPEEVLKAFGGYLPRN